MCVAIVTDPRSEISQDLDWLVQAAGHRCEACVKEESEFPSGVITASEEAQTRR